MSTQYVTISGFAIDCVLTEDPTHESEISQFPVEEGSDIADNIRVKPLSLKLEGVVTNTPIGLIATQRSSDDPRREFIELFEGIESAREPVTIIGKLKTYDSMVLTSWNIPQTSETGDAVTFSATFEQVLIVVNQFRNLRVAVPRAQGKVNLGSLGATINTFDAGLKKIGPAITRGVNTAVKVLTKPDGTRVSKDQIAKATQRPGAVKTNYVNGNPVDQDLRAIVAQGSQPQPLPGQAHPSEIQPWYQPVSSVDPRVLGSP